MKKKLLFIVGVISVILGSIGIFLPLLPTTPFLLLSLYCFGRSSKKFYNLLLENKIFGKYIKDYYEKKGITLKNKIIAMLFLSIGIFYSMIKIENKYLYIILIAVYIGVSFHIIKIKTIK